MRFEEGYSFELPLCYAVGAVTVDGAAKLLFAPDGRGPGYAVDPATGAREKLWDGPGGTMAMVPLPGRDADFLAVQGFFPDFKAEGAGVFRVRRGPRGWAMEPYLALPFVHRIGLMERGGVRYFIAATLCSGKKSVDDWSSPGAVYAGVLPADLARPPVLAPVLPGLHTNHGFCRTVRDGAEVLLVSGREGLYELTPPETPGADWNVHRRLDRPVSDIAVLDIDGDGVDELAAIEPFHGDTFSVYKPAPGGFELVYRVPEPLPFCHVVWGGRLRGEPVFLGGNRDGQRELFALRCRGGRCVRQTIASGLGPSNVFVLPGPDRDCLAVASRESGRAAVFFVTDDA